MKINSVKAFCFWLALLIAASAQAQTQPAVGQHGSVTAGHPACWFGNLRIDDCGGSPGSGTVTSVALTGDGVIFNSSVSGSPVTSSGTFNLNTAMLTQTANTILSGPVSGGAAKPTFRLMVPADLLAATTTARGGVSVPANGGLFLTGDAIGLSSPGTAQLGGILALTTSTAHQWIEYVDTSGAQHLSQPVWGDIGGGFLPVANGGTGIGVIGSANQCLQVNSAGTAYTFGGCTGPSGSSSSLSALFAATTTNTFDNANYAQSWTWNALTTETALKLSTSSGTTGRLLDVEINNAASTTGAAAFFSNTGTGANALALSVSGGFKLNAATGALSAAAGKVSIGTLSVANGGTGVTTFTVNGILAGDGAALEQTNVVNNALLVTDASGNPLEAVTIPNNVQQNITKLGSVTTGTLTLTGPNTFTGTFNLDTSTIAANGYSYLPNGFIMQWGGGTSSTSPVTVTFPLQFPNAVFSIVVSCNSTGADIGAYSSPNATNFNAVCWRAGSVPFQNTLPFTWIAIGN